MPVSSDFRQDIYTDAVASIGLEGITNSYIDFAGDVDWLRIQLEGGQHYRFYMEPNHPMSIGGGAPPSTLEPWLRAVYNEQGMVLHGNCSCQSNTGRNWGELHFTPAQSGTYLLELTSRNNTTGNYLLYIPSPTPDEHNHHDHEHEHHTPPVIHNNREPADNNSSQAVLALNTPSHNRIEVVGDQDWFRVELEAGGVYRINLDGESLVDPLIQGIYDQDGNYIPASSNDDFNGLNAQVNFIAPSSGSYFISAAAYGNHTGSYQLNINRTGSQAVPSEPTPSVIHPDYPSNINTPVTMLVNQPFNSSIQTVRDSDWVRIELLAGHRYQINLDGFSHNQAALLDPLLRGIYDQNGNYISGTSNDDYNGLNSQIYFTPSSSGSYFIAAEAYGANTGAYLLQVTCNNMPMSSDLTQLLGLPPRTLGQYIDPATIETALQTQANQPPTPRPSNPADVALMSQLQAILAPVAGSQMPMIQAQLDMLSNHPAGLASHLPSIVQNVLAMLAPQLGYNTGSLQNQLQALLAQYENTSATAQGDSQAILAQLNEILALVPANINVSGLQAQLHMLSQQPGGLAAQLPAIVQHMQSMLAPQMGYNLGPIQGQLQALMAQYGGTANTQPSNISAPSVSSLAEQIQSQLQSSTEQNPISTHPSAPSYMGNHSAGQSAAIMSQLQAILAPVAGPQMAMIQPQLDMLNNQPGGLAPHLPMIVQQVQAILAPQLGYNMGPLQGQLQTLLEQYSSGAPNSQPINTTAPSAPSHIAIPISSAIQTQIAANIRQAEADNTESAPSISGIITDIRQALMPVSSIQPPSAPNNLPNIADLLDHNQMDQLLGSTSYAPPVEQNLSNRISDQIAIATNPMVSLDLDSSFVLDHSFMF